jgi:rfaE bifunctional protein nucleotidyltransferase chain/domain
MRQAWHRLRVGCPALRPSNDDSSVLTGATAAPFATVEQQASQLLQIATAKKNSIVKSIRKSTLAPTDAVAGFQPQDHTGFEPPRAWPSTVMYFLPAATRCSPARVERASGRLRQRPTSAMNRFDPLRKVLHVDEAVARFAALPGTVFITGVFDLLHRGQVACLAEARQLGERLIVGIHSDTSAALLDKTSGRPLHGEGDRAYQVAALESVDAVVIFPESTPIPLLTRLRPSVYVRGGEQDVNRLAETALMHGWGGHVVALPFLDGFSTSSLLERIRAGSPALYGEES